MLCSNHFHSLHFSPNNSKCQFKKIEIKFAYVKNNATKTSINDKFWKELIFLFSRHKSLFEVSETNLIQLSFIQFNVTYIYFFLSRVNSEVEELELRAGLSKLQPAVHIYSARKRDK
jgi:hypothetical protein